MSWCLKSRPSGECGQVLFVNVRLFHKTDSLQIMSLFFLSLFTILYPRAPNMLTLPQNKPFFFFPIWASAFEITWKWICAGDYMYISAFISDLNPHFIHVRHLGSFGSHSPHLCWGNGVCVSAFPRGKQNCINSVLAWRDKKDEVTHQSQVKSALAGCIICTVQWSDRRSKGIKAVPEKMVGGCLSVGGDLSCPKAVVPSFPHRTAKEVPSHSFHGRENWCQWKLGYSHFTLIFNFTFLQNQLWNISQKVLPHSTNHHLLRAESAVAYLAFTKRHCG